MLTIYRSVDSVWLVTSSSSLLVCFIRICQIKILFLASSFTVQVVAYLLVCVILTKTRIQWIRPTGSSWLCHWLVFWSVKASQDGKFSRAAFQVCSFLIGTIYHGLVVECELVLISAWILQVFAFVRYPCNPVSTSVESMGTSHQLWFIQKPRIILLPLTDF